MTDRLNRQQKAFAEALWYCHAWGLNWKTNIEPKVEKREIVAYYVLDETRSTTVAIVEL